MPFYLSGDKILLFPVYSKFLPIVLPLAYLMSIARERVEVCGPRFCEKSNIDERN